MKTSLETCHWFPFLANSVLQFLLPQFPTNIISRNSTRNNFYTIIQTFQSIRFFIEGIPSVIDVKLGPVSLSRYQSVCLPSRCIRLHAQHQSLPPSGQPLPALPVPRPPVQPHRLRHRARRVRLPGRPQSGRVLFHRPTKRRPGSREPPHRDHGLRSVS